MLRRRHAGADDGPARSRSNRSGSAIEVLSQGTTTGQLAFQPVVAVHRNQPAATLRIKIGGESIVATGIHRFWKAGKGWTMARELKAGDRLRMVGGIVAIDAIEADKTQPVYNLDVALNRDFFVGTSGLSGPRLQFRATGRRAVRSHSPSWDRRLPRSK